VVLIVAPIVLLTQVARIQRASPVSEWLGQGLALVVVGLVACGLPVVGKNAIERLQRSGRDRMASVLATTLVLTYGGAILALAIFFAIVLAVSQGLF
jgi:hypothetical protein